MYKSLVDCTRNFVLARNVELRQHENLGRLKVNIGNIYFRKKDYAKAIKYYRMALDQVPNVQKRARIKILHNIGVAFVRLGRYDDAISTFEHCMEEKPDYRTGLNLILSAYTLEDKDRMKGAFLKLLEIPPEGEEEDKYTLTQSDPHELMIMQVIRNDSLHHWERKRRQEAERTLLTAARIISPNVAPTFSEGYAWCVDQIKQSLYTDLASDLEINKAIQFIRQRDISAAIEALKTFEKKDSKVASAAANNLSFMYFLQRDYGEATRYAEQGMAADRYNPSALVNRGNVSFAGGDYEKAIDYYREALNTEATCVEALYNFGLACKRMQRMEEALDCFGKLHAILRHNVQVMYQIGNIYEMLEDINAALEWYSMAQSMSPFDPGILAKLGELYDREGDKSQAFQYHYDSYRYFPSNISVIEWLGAYYIDAQFSEKAVNYFEKAALIQPNEVRWQLMIASCHRRSGNYQKALETYKQIHRKFPENVESLKFLVRINKDLGNKKEMDEYAMKLQKAEKIKQLREERGSSSAGRMLVSASSSSAGVAGRPPSSRGSLRTASGKSHRVNFDNIENEPYEMSNKKAIDASYSDPIGPSPVRPRTAGLKRQEDDLGFQDEEIGDDLLPE